ncbi:hypothetical protein IZU89_12425 [Cellulophaga lytica]|uniref:hypothetical protein n=1 Tax=Cellulophaga lytica TaxID=979 RepID=UPI0032E4C9B0
MNIIEHTTNWYKGEIFEGTLIGIAGVLLIIVSMAFWKFGKTPNAQAMVIPLAVVGLFIGASGFFMSSGNSKALEKITASQIDNQSFVQSEKKRVADFQALYLYTKIGAGICFTIATLLFFISENRHLLAVGIALIIIGISGLTIDYFSKERADVYYNQLIKQAK